MVVLDLTAAEQAFDTCKSESNYCPFLVHQTTQYSQSGDLPQILWGFVQLQCCLNMIIVKYNFVLFYLTQEIC